MKIQSSKSGIDYLEGILRISPRTVTRALIWRIAHASGKQGLSLKLGRYNKDPEDFDLETLESKTPKSELTLTEEELENLVAFLAKNFAALRDGLRNYIPIENESEEIALSKLKVLLANPDKERLVKLITENNIVPEDVLVGIETQKRRNAIAEFEIMLEQDVVEPQWQKWFQRNAWVLGTEFVKILDERAIDTSNVSDFLMQAYDGFLDVVEIKRPGGNLDYWAKSTDHGNYYPSTDLTKAIAQSNAYVYELEREANSIKFQARLSGVRTVKPRCVLLFGRSKGWNEAQKEAYRVLNASYHSLTIMTYDHALSRAKRMIDTSDNTGSPDINDNLDDDIPF